MNTDPVWQPGDMLRCTDATGPLAMGQPCRLLSLDSGVATVEAHGLTLQCPAASLRLSVPARPAPGRYRHCRGGLYTLVCVARHSETEEWMVAYTSEQTGDHWVRPLAMWSEAVGGRARFEAEEASKAGPCPDPQRVRGPFDPLT